jgi:hypothetical protein
VDTLPEEKDGYVLHPDLLNSKLLEAQYAVRGELYLRAEELKKEGKQIIYTNGMPPPLTPRYATRATNLPTLCSKRCIYGRCYMCSCSWQSSGLGS